MTTIPARKMTSYVPPEELVLDRLRWLRRAKGRVGDHTRTLERLEAVLEKKPWEHYGLSFEQYVDIILFKVPTLLWEPEP
jgi:hypothetical protein